MPVMPLPIPPQALKKWWASLTALIQVTAEIAEGKAREIADSQRMLRLQREQRQQAIAAAEALIPQLNALKFSPGGIADTATALLTEPSGHLEAEFARMVKASSKVLAKMNASIDNAAALEAKLGARMQLVRDIATQKAGLFIHTFSGPEFARYAHARKPVKEAQAMVTRLNEMVADVNGKIDKAVAQLHHFVETQKQAQ